MATTPQKKTPSKSSQTPAPEASGPDRAKTRREPSAEQISARAYELYLARGGNHGRDQDDWFQAERELKLGRQ